VRLLRPRSFLRTGLPASLWSSLDWLPNPRSGTPRSGYRGSDLVQWHYSEVLAGAANFVSYPRVDLPWPRANPPCSKRKLVLSGPSKFGWRARSVCDMPLRTPLASSRRPSFASSTRRMVSELTRPSAEQFGAFGRRSEKYQGVVGNDEDIARSPTEQAASCVGQASVCDLSVHSGSSRPAWPTVSAC